LFSCAQVVAPGGGPADKTPPKVVRYNPDSAKLNFDAKNIEITFDEYIQLKDLNNQLIISPPLAKTPDISVRSKTMNIVFDKNEVLKPNTTYSIYFGNALQDINENNPKENFRYIFSTGNYIDSLGLKGTVKWAFDHKTEKGILVLLYSSKSDSAVFKEQPDYFTRTAADGSFSLNNIHPGDYQIAAIKDVNSNFRYDEGVEAIAFVDGRVSPGQKNSIDMEMFQEPEKKISVKKYMHEQYGKISIYLTQGSDSIRLTNLSNIGKGVQEFVDFSDHHDTIHYWIKNFTGDSLKLQVNNGNKVIDTLEFKMIKLEDALKSKKKPLKLKVIAGPNGNQSYDLNATFNLQFSAPLEDVSQDAQLPVLFKEDTVQTKTTLLIENDKVFLPVPGDSVMVEDPNDPGKLILEWSLEHKKKWKENTKYEVLILPGTLTDIFGLKNDSVKVEFKTREEKFYGSLKLDLKVYTSEQFIVQLMSENGTVVRTDNISESQVLNYDHLYPQKYKLRVIDDWNTDGEWTPGSFRNKKQSEPVIYNSETIMIRSNWDADLSWEVKYEVK
jgi:uncharacterized protein (DUF2141 family)